MDITVKLRKSKSLDTHKTVYIDPKENIMIHISADNWDDGLEILRIIRDQIDQMGYEE